MYSQSFKISALKRAEYNPRQISEREMEALILSIETHGFVEPIVVNVHPDRYGTIVGGHQRLTAVEKIVAKRKVPPIGIEATDKNPEAEISMDALSIPAFTVELSLEAEKALNVGLNKIHGEFDEAKLTDLIVSIKDSPVLPTTGFSADELASMLGIPSTGKPKDEHVEGQCARCLEIRSSYEGHARKSGHKPNLNGTEQK